MPQVFIIHIPELEVKDSLEVDYLTSQHLADFLWPHSLTHTERCGKNVFASGGFWSKQSLSTSMISYSGINAKIR